MLKMIVMLVVLVSLLMETAMVSGGQNDLPPVDDPVYMKGSSRPRAPANWVKFDWTRKKEILFGQYAPTDEEKKRIMEAMPQKAAAKPDKKRRLLVFYRCQYPHAAIASCNFAIEQMAKTTGAFAADFTDDPAAMNKTNLKNYDAVLFNNTTTWEKTLSDESRKAILDYVRGGKGFIGIHAAADSCAKWKEGQELIGAVFAGHPWTAKQAWAFKVESPGHVLNKGFDNMGFWHCEEVYVFRGNAPDRKRSRVLLSVDMSKDRNINLLDKDRRAKVKKDGQYDVAWIHSYGKGKMFYTSLGHNFSTYWQPKILQHYLAGIQFVLGDIEADMTPSAELADVEIALAPRWE